MGRVIALDGLDSKATALVTGSLYVTDVSAVSTPYILTWDPATDLVTHQSYARANTSSSVAYDVDITAVGWTFSSVTNGNPTSAGQISVDSSTATAVSTVKLNKTANASSNQTTQLEGLAVSSSFTLTQAGGGVGTGLYRIVSRADNTSYMTYAVTYVGNGSGTYNVSSTVTVDTTTNDTFYEYFITPGYNRLHVTNSGDAGDRLRLKASSSIATGTHVIVEAYISPSSQNVPISYQARSGSVSTTGQVNKDLFTIGSSGTAAAVLVDTSDVMIMEFLCWGNPSEVNFGLAPTVATQTVNL